MLKVRSKMLSWILREAIILTNLGLPPAIICLTEGAQAKFSNIFIGRSSGDKTSMLWTALFIGQVVTGLTSYPISAGVAAYANILCSQAYGAKQYRLVGLYYYRALFMAALTIFPLCTIFICVRPFIYAVTQDWELAYQVDRYLTILCFAYPPYLYLKVAIAYLQAQNIVWPSLLYLVLSNIVNGVLQYFLIMQYDSGLAGSAAGYAISLYVLCLMLYAHVRLTNVHTSTYIEWSVDMIGEWYHTVKYAMSTTIQSFAATFTTGLIPLLVLGVIARDETQIGIYSVLFSLGYVFYLFGAGFGSAMTVRLGNLLGANDPVQAKKSAIFGFIFGGIVLILNSVVLFLLSEPLGYLFTTDTQIASKLSFSIKVLSLTIFSGIVLLEEAILNACCLQQVDAVLKFIFRILLGSVIGFVWANYVEWKALSLLATAAIMCYICTVIGLLVVPCYSWETLVLKVSENTGMDLEGTEIEMPKAPKYSVLFRSLCDCKLYSSKMFILFRYSVAILLGFIIFVIAFGVIF